MYIPSMAADLGLCEAKRVRWRCPAGVLNAVGEATPTLGQFVLCVYDGHFNDHTT